MPVTFEIRTRIAAPRSVVFDLELDMDVHTASLRKSREMATTSHGRPALLLGDEVTFTARHLGLPWRLTSRIMSYDRQKAFTDEQVRGPFRSMRHDHVFEETSRGMTEMVDRMTIEAPLGPLGDLVARTVLKPYMSGLLRTRAAHVKRLAEHR